MNLVPDFKVLLTSTFPPCASAMPRTRARPSPHPWSPLFPRRLHLLKRFEKRLLVLNRNRVAHIVHDNGGHSAQASQGHGYGESGDPYLIALPTRFSSNLRIPSLLQSPAKHSEYLKWTRPS